MELPRSPMGRCELPRCEPGEFKGSVFGGYVHFRIIAKNRFWLFTR